MSIRLIRIATGPDGQSHFSVGAVLLHPAGDNAVSAAGAVGTISFEESPAGAALDWHNAPARQYVITLSGTLEFENRMGEKQVVAPGDLLLAEDTTGGGHRWRLVDDQPWRRVYVTLAQGDPGPA